MKKIFILFFLIGSVFANVGKITIVRGDAVVLSNGQENVATLNYVLNENDKVITKNNAKLQIQFIDDTIVTIGRNTTFEINKYVINGKNSNVKLAVNEGDFKVISGQISKIARENFEFKANTATIGIRGTVFVGNIKENSSKIGCLQGSIKVKHGNKSSLVKAGYQMNLDKKNAKISKISLKEYESTSSPAQNTPKTDVKNNLQKSDAVNKENITPNISKSIDKAISNNKKTFDKNKDNKNGFNKKGKNNSSNMRIENKVQNRINNAINIANTINHCQGESCRQYQYYGKNKGGYKGGEYGKGSNNDGKYGKGSNNDGKYGKGGKGSNNGSGGYGKGSNNDGEYGKGGKGSNNDGKYGKGGKGSNNDGEYGKGGKGSNNDGEYGKGGKGSNNDGGGYGKGGGRYNNGKNCSHCNSKPELKQQDCLKKCRQ